MLPAQLHSSGDFSLKVVSTQLQSLPKVHILLDNIKGHTFDRDRLVDDVLIEHDFRLVQVHPESNTSRGDIETGQHFLQILQRFSYFNYIFGKAEMCEIFAVAVDA
ncbi:hypothetical protein O0L34_g216 [Tuta absoluta]|nr:hypothetical protein O0L34_g216 [Tuta absoluta]